MTNGTTSSVAADRPLSTVSDEELLLEYRERKKQDAFRELVHRYEGPLFSYLRHYTHDAGLAEEVFQSTFLRLHEKSKEYEEGRPVRPWIYSIATHLAIDALRKAGRRHAVSLDAQQVDAGPDAGTLLDLLHDTLPEPVAKASDEERHAWARRAVDELPEYLRTVVLLIYFQGLKYREAAEVLGLPVGTVKSRMHMALVRLHSTWKRSHLDPHEE